MPKNFSSRRIGRSKYLCAMLSVPIAVFLLWAILSYTQMVEEEKANNTYEKLCFANNGFENHAIIQGFRRESFHIKVIAQENFPSAPLRGRKASETGIGNSRFLIIFKFYRVILCLPPAFYRGYTLNAHNYFNVGVSIVILVLYATIWLVFKRTKS